jgi:hypothetical protein
MANRQGGFAERGDSRASRVCPETLSETNVRVRSRQPRKESIISYHMKFTMRGLSAAIILVLLSAPGVLHAQRDTPRVIVVTDVQGNTTTLSPYGVYYKPVGTATLNDAFMNGLIVERGPASETFAWPDITKVEINGKLATLSLKSGKKVENAELRHGTVVGKTQSGGEYSLDLMQAKTITTALK